MTFEMFEQLSLFFCFVLPAGLLFWGGIIIGTVALYKYWRGLD